MVISKLFFRTYFEINIESKAGTILTIQKWYFLIGRIKASYSKNEKDEHKKDNFLKNYS